ncbi:hypothetical protein TNCV_2120011 [Trichonephila clavipes]|nr:hypothetical protein TNCV_2120011 [Trichonephila clavipes]
MVKKSPSQYGGYDPRLVTEWVRVRIPKSEYLNHRVVGILVVRASDFRPENLGDRCPIPPNILPEYTRSLYSLNQWARKSRGWSQKKPRVQENISLSSNPCLNCGERDRWCCRLSCGSLTCLKLWQLSFLLGRTQQHQLKFSQPPFGVDFHKTLSQLIFTL